MNHVLPPDLFSGLLAIAADAVIAVDAEQRIISFNEGAERIFDWTAAEVGGQYLEILLPERYRAAHRGHVHGSARRMGVLGSWASGSRSADSGSPARSFPPRPRSSACRWMGPRSTPRCCATSARANVLSSSRFRCEGRVSVVDHVGGGCYGSIRIGVLLNASA